MSQKPPSDREEQLAISHARSYTAPGVTVFCEANRRGHPRKRPPDQPIGCFGPQASDYTERILTKRIVRLEIPCIGDSENAYGRTLAYVYLDANGDGEYEDLIELGLARTTTFSHAYRREFERLREEAETKRAGLWGACPEVRSY